MVGTWTYNAGTNTITVTGGTSGSPAGFVDAWNADKAGTFTIVNARNITGADGSPVAVSNALRPTDYYVLGGSKLYITVTNFTANSTIKVVGTDANGTSINENIAVTGNGNYNTALFYHTVTSTQVTTFGGNFTYTMIQAQWGVVWKGQCTVTANRIQYIFGCYLVIGDGSTPTYFADSYKQISWTNFAHWAGTNLVVIKNGASVIFGALISGHATKDGCSFLSSSSGEHLFDLSSGNGTLELYGCHFYAPACVIYAMSAKVTAYNCIFDEAYFQSSTNLDCYNINFINNYACFVSSSGTFNYIKGGLKSDGYYAIYLFHGESVTVKNCAFTQIAVAGAPYLISCSSITADSYLINAEADDWKINWIGGAANTGKAYRQYEFDLTTDTSATVTLKDNSNNTVFSVVSDAVTGAIATQTVSRGYYQQATGDTLQDYGPFMLTISKTGKMPYTETGIFLTAKTAWEIKLRNQLSGDAVVGDVTTGKKFYKDDADTQLTGTCNTPVLTGNATPSDVSSGKTFYKDDPNTKLTGTAKSPSILVTLDGHILARVGKDKPDYISL